MVTKTTSIVDIQGQINQVIRQNAQHRVEWLSRYIKPRMAEPPPPSIPVAPVGIGVFGVREDDSIFALSTNAVRGEVEISPDISALGYNYNSGSYEHAFSIQLNAYVASRLMDGTTQYYWIQNTIGVKESRVDVNSYVWNLDEDLPAAVFGNGVSYGKFYRHFHEFDLFERNTLETEVYVENGNIIVEFYANREMYDRAIVTPYIPAYSAHIVVAPTALHDDSPLNLELIFGGYGHLISWTILRRGRIGLELHVRENGKWVPPPSAWSVGYSTYETAHAHVIPRRVGSVLVVPGAPNPQQLW